MSLEFKSFGLEIHETKQMEVNGQKVGVFTGHASTFDVDSSRDQMVPGVFSNALNLMKSQNKTQIQMKFMHRRDQVIGGFPVLRAREDSVGLFVEGNINLEVQKGREVFSLLKQGVFTDMSIGFFIKDAILDESDDIRKIKEIEIVETSIVDIGDNRNANIIEVKSVDQFKSLRDVNDFLKSFGLSNKEANTLISKVKSFLPRDDGNSENIAEKVNERIVLMKLDTILNIAR